MKFLKNGGRNDMFIKKNRKEKWSNFLEYKVKRIEMEKKKKKINN